MSTREMIDCEEVLRVMFAYLDGELDDADRGRVDAHLERCRSCLSRAEFERRLKGRLAELASAPVSPEFERRIVSLIGEPHDPESGEPERPARGGR